MIANSSKKYLTNVIKSTSNWEPITLNDSKSRTEELTSESAADSHKETMTENFKQRDRNEQNDMEDLQQRKYLTKKLVSGVKYKQLEKSMLEESIRD